MKKILFLLFLTPCLASAQTWTTKQLSAKLRSTTAWIKNCVPGAGSFTITLGAAATSEVSIGFTVIN